MKNRKIKISVEPIGKRIFLNEPTGGIKAIIDAGLGIKSVCAGKGTCGKCRIVILNKEKKPASKQEQEILSSDEIDNGVRLACQQIFDRNLIIYIPSSSLSEEQKFQVRGKEKIIEVDPVCKKYFVKLKEANLGDLESDFNRIKSFLKNKYNLKVNSIDYRSLVEMSYIIRSNSWEIVVTIRNDEIILIEGKDRTKNNFGLAIDLGTTKIAFLLVDLVTGKTIDSKGVMNPQVSYGEDVMSRLNFAMQSQDNANKIQKVVVAKINEVVSELCRKNNLTHKEITEMTIVGNTAMHHLLLGLPVNQLGLSPFVSVTNDSLQIKAREIGIKIAPGGYIFLPPPIAGFVGSDHLAVILATEIYKKKGNYLGIDIGTNTEIVLKSGKKITSVSTASGPAFEGAHIKYGMRAAPGAIERVLIDSKTCIPSVQTINDIKPVGICGSGILDVIAELLKAGIINRNGKFKTDLDCVRRDSKGEFSYILVPSGGGNRRRENSNVLENGKCFTKRCGEKDISINQKDIVEIQLAKGAIRAGIEVLLEHADISFKDIDRIIIAGAFGSYIDPKNVINIGMFPNVQLRKIRQVGNAAGVGAKMILISKKQRANAEKIAKKIRYLELVVFSGFNNHFINSMQFPAPDEII